MAKQKRVVVVGGGISGLSAAFYLRKSWLEQQTGDTALDIAVLEKSGSFGGKISTTRKDGFIIENGPDSFLARKLPIIELTRELGMEDELVRTGEHAGKTYIVLNGEMHPMPPGMILGVPIDLDAFRQTSLLSQAGIERAIGELDLPPQPADGDEPLGRFLERRFGKEMLENISEPLLAGIYAGDTYALSLLATFPQFREMEQTFGSVIRGMQESRKQAKPPAASPLPKAVQGSMFLSYRNGLQSLPERLVAALAAETERVSVRLAAKTGVSAVRKDGAGYEVIADNGEKLFADAVVMAAPAFAAAKLLGGLPETERLGNIRYVSVANVVMGFDKNDLGRELDASGFLVPRKEGRLITASTWTSSKWPHTAPEGKALLRCYVGRAGQEEWRQLSDEQLVAGVRRDMSELAGVAAEPTFVHVNRWLESMPQYPVGHLELIREAQRTLDERMPGVILVGAALNGVGIPDCIGTAKAAAQRVAALLAD